MKKEVGLDTLLNKEWIITNGIGGYAYSTVTGANTRKYHGLLVAPLSPPAQRYLILSKVDESIEIENKKYNLYTNVCRGYISDGYKYIKDFKKSYLPVTTYDVEGIKIKKTVSMVYRKNTVCISYEIQNKDKKATLTLAPILNFRDFHCMSTNWEYNIGEYQTGNKVKLVINDNINTPVYIRCSEGKYIKHTNDVFRNMYYIEEEKRGFYPEENLCVSGRYEVEILPGENKKITFVCSLEENIDEIDAKDVIKQEIKRLDKIAESSGILNSIDKKEEQFLKDFIIASDNFVVYRPSFVLHTLIAGYPWFLDWGRDALISFEGLLLVTKRFDIAKEVLLTFVRDIKFGLVPNGYSGFDNRPLYNSADASLLLFEQVKKYLNYTGDYEFVEEELYMHLVNIINSYKKGIDVDNNNIYLDEDYLISSGTKTTQNTWMDAKYGDYAVTPRNGKAVEINAMWYNALKIMEELSKKFKNAQMAKDYLTFANKAKKSFNEKFYNEKTKCLYDVIGDPKIRPNQLFSISLSYPVLDTTSKVVKEMMNVVTKKLLNNYGIKTLAKGEEGYTEIYEGDSYKRDTSYHQGITWPWLLGLYYDALKNIIKNEKDKIEKEKYELELDKLKKTTYKTFKKSFYEDGIIGSISELYDSCKPQMAKGALAQGWSVSEILRICL